MKEDVLEQLVDDYLQLKGYFTRHNIKYRPDDRHPEYIKLQDSNHSDIDVIGINPFLKGPDRVFAVSCKSWQAGFNPETWIENIAKDKKISGRKAWKFFRELIVPKWSDAFLKAIKDTTGADEFTYVTAVTYLNGVKDVWQNHQPFVNAIKGNPIKIITFKEMIGDILPELATAVEGSQFSRTLQLLKASGYTVILKGG